MNNPGRRQFLLAAGSAGLCACSNIPTAQVLTDAFSVGKEWDRYPMAPEQIRASPYALLGVRVNEGPRAVMVLAKIDGPDLHWVSADRALLVTRFGRIVKTAGFPLNLRETLLPEVVETALARYAETGTLPADAKLQMEFDSGDIRSHAVSARYRAGGTTRFDSAVFQGREVVGVVESLDFPALRWTATNTYWYEKSSGRFLYGAQGIHPEKLARFETEILKPAAL